MKHNPGIGATNELSLRVSVATLVRVVFENPTNGEWMLALERKATLHETKVEVKSQPFGGTIRILDLNALHDLIGDFHFDSERSRSEQDFRLFIRPTDWEIVRDVCIQHLSRVDDPILETDPDRELTEEFADALKISLKSGQYIRMLVATIVEDEAAPTENIHAKGTPTVRVYHIFEATILDPSLAQTMIQNSENLSHRDICDLALKDAESGGKGWANAILTMPLKHITDAYLAMHPKARNAPILFEKHLLDETVSAVLQGLAAPKYQSL